VICINYRR